VSSEQQSSQLIEMDALLRQMAEKEASDLFVTVGMPPSLKINGSVVPLVDKPLDI